MVREIPIIAMTANAFVEDVHVAKPVDMAVPDQAAKEVFGKNRKWQLCGAGEIPRPVLPGGWGQQIVRQFVSVDSFVGDK